MSMYILIFSAIICQLGYFRQRKPYLVTASQQKNSCATEATTENKIRNFENVAVGSLLVVEDGLSEICKKKIKKKPASNRRKV